MISHEFESRCYLRKELNPYNEKLRQFDSFVYLDTEAEIFKNNWQKNVFNNQNPLTVEIGVGYGDFMFNYCQTHPNQNYIGLDIRFKRSFGVAKKLETLPEKNFRLLRAQGQRLPWLFAEREIDQLFCFFPDPWPKTKQHKKRLFQKKFLDSLSTLIKKNGFIFFKTDHTDLYEWTLREIEKCEKLKLVWKSNDLYKSFNELTDSNTKNLLHNLVTFQTKFEKIFLQQKSLIKAIILCPHP